MNKAQRVLKLIEDDSHLDAQKKAHDIQSVINDLNTALSKAKHPEKQKYLRDRIQTKKDQLAMLRKKPEEKPKQQNTAMGGSAAAQGSVNSLGAIPVGPLKKRKWRNR